MFDLFWVPNFIKIKQIAILRPNLPKFFIMVQGPQFQISYLWLTNLTCSNYQISKHWEYISLFGPNFREMRRLILVLMLNGMLLGHNFDFLGGYCSLPSGYLSLQGWKLFFKTCLARCPEEIIISLNIYENLSDINFYSFLWNFSKHQLLLRTVFLLIYKSQIYVVRYINVSPLDNKSQIYVICYQKKLVLPLIHSLLKLFSLYVLCNGNKVCLNIE